MPNSHNHSRKNILNDIQLPNLNQSFDEYRHSPKETAMDAFYLK